MELACEEIDTEVAQLARLNRGRDADHLARTALEDDEITDTDEVAGDSDGIGGEAAARLDEANVLAHALADAGGPCFVAGHDHLFLAAIVVVMVVAEGVEDAVSSSFDAAAKAVVVSFVVVIAHIVFPVGLVGSVDLFFGDFDVVVRSLVTVFDFVGWVGTATVIALGDVELRFKGLVLGVAAVDLDIDSVVFCWTAVAEGPSDQSWKMRVPQSLTVRV